MAASIAAMTIPFSPVSPVLAADDDNGDISTVTTSTTITIPDPTPPVNTPTPTKPDPLSTDHITATWNSIDGLKTNDENKSENKFVSFDPSAYKAMKDDESRTPLFERAIQQRLQNSPDNIPASEQVVLDIGTGPFALFAITAAQAGAGKVYAIEANREAAKSARATVQQLGLTNTITILEGFSTEITLPTKADFVIAEIVGSIATEEGAYATILDAHERHVKKPEEGSSWIPSRIQTFAAPAGYTLHNMFSPPAFDWGKLKGEPVRFNCRDEALQILSDPVVVEDIEFKDVKRGVPRRLGGSTLTSQQISFVIDGERMNDNRVKFRDELRRGGLRKLELEQMTTKTGQTVSGIAMWPRILLDTEEQILINTRTYPKGDHQKSHWQTVLPIMSDEPVRVKDGDEVLVTVDFNVPDSVLSAPTYKLDGDILHYS